MKACFAICLTMLLCIQLFSPAATADVEPGEVINKTNWQKGEGLVPESIVAGFTSVSACESAEEKMRFFMLSIQDVVDDRSRHATLGEVASRRNIWTFHANIGLDDFTLSGFQKYCK